MFPDSEIAKGYRQGKTKANYVVQFGIASAVKEQLVREIKDKPYSSTKPDNFPFI